MADLADVILNEDRVVLLGEERTDSPSPSPSVALAQRPTKEPTSLADHGTDMISGAVMPLSAVSRLKQEP